MIQGHLSWVRKCISLRRHNMGPHGGTIVLIRIEDGSHHSWIQHLLCRQIKVILAAKTKKNACSTKYILLWPYYIYASCGNSYEPLTKLATNVNHLNIGTIKRHSSFNIHIGTPHPRLLNTTCCNSRVSNVHKQEHPTVVPNVCGREPKWNWEW